MHRTNLIQLHLQALHHINSALDLIREEPTERAPIPRKKKPTTRCNKHWTKEELKLLSQGKRVPGRSKSAQHSKRHELKKGSKLKLAKAA